jgi:hypothetical protein
MKKFVYSPALRPGGALRSEAILDFLSRLCQLSKRLNSIFVKNELNKNKN